jgi:Rrf2 family protein
MFSQTAEYALRAVVYLAEHPDKPYTIQQIAGPTQIPAGYLAKVLQELARAGLLTSQRGLGGGFALAVPAEELTVYDVVQPVDPIRRITRCPVNNPAHAGGALCPLHRRLDEAAATVERTFRETRIADIVAQQTFAGVGGK